MSHSPMRICCSLLLSLLSLFATAGESHAQIAEPVGPFAVDARVVFPRFKEDTGIASALGVSSENLPSRGLGLAGGGHWYPVHMGPVTLGLGAEIIISRGSNTLEPETEGAPAGPTVNTRFSAFTPQLSLNFGSGRGWSYLTGGLGWGAFRTERANDPVGEPDSTPRVFNYGGGARWFAKKHVAFALDLRFYVVNAQIATIERPAYPATTMMVFSGGVSFK
jgi:hypothetical protein